MRFFGTIATGGDTHLWLECDKRWNCVVLAMSVVRIYHIVLVPCIDTQYSTIGELKKLANRSVFSG